MMEPCLWGVDQSCLGIASGAPCWQASSNTSTRAVTKLHTAHHIPWHHGTVSRGQRWFAKSKDEVPCSVGTRMDPGLGGEGQGATPGIALGCRAEWGGVDIPTAPHPTCLRGATVQGNPFPQT